MTYTIVGDPHAKPDNLDKIEILFDMIEDLGNPTIILGDLLDTKELVRGSCLNTYLKRLKASKLKYWILVGNHDWFNLECENHSLEALKELSNVTVVDKPLAIGELVFLPYMHDAEALKAALKGKPGKTVFCHVDIKGFDFGNGHISDAGLDLADLAQAKAVISGHYHKYQQVGRVTYLGTPFSHSFGESNQEKYLGIFNEKTGALELVPTPFPKHVTLTLDCGDYGSAEVNDVDLYRIVLTGTQEEIDRHVKVDGVKYIEQPTGLIKAANIVETDSPEQQFIKWAKDIKGYTKDVVNLGLEILKNV